MNLHFDAHISAGIGVRGQCTSIYELEITQITDLWLIK